MWTKRREVGHVLKGPDMEHSVLLQTRAVPAIGIGLWRTIYLLVIKLWGVQAVTGVGQITVVVTRSILAEAASAAAPRDASAESWEHRPAPPPCKRGQPRSQGSALGCSAPTVVWWEPSRECPASAGSHCGMVVLLVHLQAHSPQALPVESTLLIHQWESGARVAVPRSGDWDAGFKYCHVCWSGDLKGGLDLSWAARGSILLGIGCKRIEEGLHANLFTSVPSHILPSALHIFPFLGLLEWVALTLKYFPEFKELMAYTEDSSLPFILFFLIF